MRAPEVTTVAEDEVVVHDGWKVRTYRGLEPGTVHDLDGIEARTLDHPGGELLCRFATVNDVNYSGSASGTLNILAASIAGIEANGPTTFTGIAGAELAGGRPSVRVFDGNNAGVPSVTVVFTVTAGGGSGSASVATDANDIATVPSWLPTTSNIYPITACSTKNVISLLDTCPAWCRSKVCRWD